MKGIILGLALLSGMTFASEEEFLGWSSASVQLSGTRDAGQVCVNAAEESGTWSSFAISAFGKVHQLSDEELAMLSGFPLSSLRTTHEQGYEELGGYTIHFRFERTFYRPSYELVSEIIYVSVNRTGLSVSEPRVTR